MKKGLRHKMKIWYAKAYCQNRRPDEEGIKTLSIHIPLAIYRQNRRPDEEGIKTGG